jgi:GTP-binding protein
MLKIKDSSFNKSIVKLDNRPKPRLPEIAFAGRSNVGKSSLINKLVKRNNFARISKSPGKTRTINFYLINQIFYMVDLPGYGFAKVSKTEKENWRRMIENYILNSKELKRLYILIDSKVGLQKNDIQLLEWIVHHKIPFRIILTKSDKISRNLQNVRIKELQKLIDGIDPNFIFIFSAKDNSGREEVLKSIEELLL